MPTPTQIANAAAERGAPGTDDQPSGAVSCAEANHEGEAATSAPLTPDSMSSDERSCLLYLETRAVDEGGLCEGIRMNAADFDACARFRELGWLDFWRIPFSLLAESTKASWTHIVRMKPEGWRVAHELRQRRALQVGPFATKARALLEERERFTPADGASSPRTRRQPSPRDE